MQYARFRGRRTMAIKSQILTADMPANAGSEIDRVTPTLCPQDRIVMRHNWYDLTFLHWIVPVEMLRPLIPAELEIDTYEGRAYVGLVPFTMRQVRPAWAPAFPPLSNFHETNVRTYVHLHGRSPGVWFFSLDAANSIAVRVARRLWKLPYHFARMSLIHERQIANLHRSSSLAPTVHYQSERVWPGPVPATCDLRCSPNGPVQPADVGTLEHFLVERYLLYAYRDRRLYCGQVHHTAYPLQTATVHRLQEKMSAAAGLRLPETAPIAHYASAVQVLIFPLRAVSGVE